VHHGWFWKNEDPRVRGPRRTRLALTLAHDRNPFPYHVPLVAHPQWGRNAPLARGLGPEPECDAAAAPPARGPDNRTGLGTAPGLDTLDALAERVRQRLGRAPLVVGEPGRPLGGVAWCTGAAQGMRADAVQAGADAYITGEASEPAVHLARETGTGFIGAGHHATERYGVQALGQAVAQQFGIRVEFVDINNPV